MGENSLIPAQTRPHCPAGIQEASQSWPGHDPAPRGTRWQVPLYRRQFILRVRPETVRQRFSGAHFPRTLTSLKPGCVSIDGMSQIRSTTLLPRKRYVTVCGILGSTNIGLAALGTHVTHQPEPDPSAPQHARGVPVSQCHTPSHCEVTGYILESTKNSINNEETP